MDITKIKSLIVPLMYVKTTVEQGGFTQAARYLGKTQPHISREVKRLEKLFNVTLFSRIPRGMIATHEGMEVYKQAEKLNALFYELENCSLPKNNVSGRLTISMTDGIGIYLISHLAEFHELCPKVCVNVISGHNEMNLRERKADIAIVYKYPPQDNALVVEEFKREFGLFASTSYINRHGMPKSIDDLLNRHALSNRSEYNENWEEWRRMMAEARETVLCCDSSNLLIQATDSGTAVSLQPLQYGLHHKDWVYLDLGLKLYHSCWVISHHDDQKTEKIKTMLEFIRRIMAKI